MHLSFRLPRRHVVSLSSKTKLLPPGSRLSHTRPHRHLPKSNPAFVSSQMADGQVQNTADVKQKGKQSPWYPPPRPEEPVLKVFNSLTKEKVPFNPISGRHVKWYNCGPTVYDAAHLGHARNYVSQDVIRRIMVDYFGYDVQFVMNITDIDDKIIIRARQNYLLEQLMSSTTTLTTELLAQTEEAWSEYILSKLVKSLPDADKPKDGETLEQTWQRILEKEASDTAWLNAMKLSDEKFTMNITALKAAKAAIQLASSVVYSGVATADHAKTLINSSKDVLAAHLDKKYGSTITDPSVSRALGAYWEDAFFKDMSRLRVVPPDTTTRVTEYVPEIVTFVEKVIANKFAYATEDGSVYFDTRAFDGSERDTKDPQRKEEWNHFYAKLQPTKKGNMEALEEGEGALSTGASKRHPSDFALWKASKPGEPSWPSPWGPGRPGWHIECSVMATEILGESMDIHSGGVDLMFPHHDNEIAQSEAYHDCRQWVNYFLHTGHLHIEGLKMSKSLKNFISVDDALSKYTARQLRLSFLFQLWSNQMDFKESSMAEVRAAESAINNFFSVAKALIFEARSKGMVSDGRHHYDEAEKELAVFLTQTQHSFRTALCDSFNTPDALARILDLVSRTNVYLSRGRGSVNVGVVETVASWITRMLRMFGLGEGPALKGAIGWGDTEKDGSDNLGAGDRDSILMPYLQTLSTFRDNVRQLAISQAPAKEILMLCDKLRDVDLIPLGVALDDQEDGRALVKLISPDALQKQREEKLAAQEAKTAKKKAAQEAENAKRIARLEKGKMSHEEMFKPPNVPEGTYGSWNEDTGLPLTDGDGAELPKAKLKKLQKEWEIQQKLHRDYNEWVRTGSK